jgi:hypothetical protein
MHNDQCSGHHAARAGGGRCLGERGFALLTGRWRTLQHITASASKISDIACCKGLRTRA